MFQNVLMYVAKDTLNILGSCAGELHRRPELCLACHHFATNYADFCNDLLTPLIGLYRLSLSRVLTDPHGNSPCTVPLGALPVLLVPVLVLLVVQPSIYYCYYTTKVLETCNNTISPPQHHRGDTIPWEEGVAESDMHQTCCLLYHI